MIGHNVDVKTSGGKNDKSNEASRSLKQRLKGKRLKKRFKKDGDSNKLADGPFHCCETKFETNLSFREHKREIHNMEDSDSEEKIYPCKVCGIVYDNKTDHTGHLEKQHGVGKANACPLCLVVLEDRVKRYDYIYKHLP